MIKEISLTEKMQIDCQMEVKQNFKSHYRESQLSEGNETQNVWEHKVFCLFASNIFSRK